MTTGCEQLRTKHAPKRVPTKEFDNLIAEKKEEYGVKENGGYFKVNK